MAFDESTQPREINSASANRDRVWCIYRFTLDHFGDEYSQIYYIMQGQYVNIWLQLVFATFRSMYILVLRYTYHI